VHEYAKERNIKSKDVVKKLHQLGYTTVKNHLSLIPERIIDDLDRVQFPPAKQIIPKQNKQICMISLECSPFISNGLGDMVKNRIEYGQIHGNHIKVILPKFKMNSEHLVYIKDVTVSVSHQTRVGKVYQYEENNIEYYFIENDYYFNRDNLYGFYDDAERFAFLIKASIELISSFNINFNTINIHDWPLGLFPILYKEKFVEKYNSVIEFSIYGSTYQGIYGLDVLTEVFGIDRKYFDDKTAEYANSVNLLKAGIVTANKVDINKVALNDLKSSYLKQYIYDNM